MSNLVLGWGACLLLGVALWLALAGRPRVSAQWLTAAGHAPLLGLAACGLLVALRPDVPGDALFRASLPLLGAALLLAGGAAIWRWRTAVPAAVPAADTPLRWWWLLLIPIAVRFVFLLDEALLRPVFAWDAWNAWSLKAKTWYSLGQVPFLAPADWWASDDPLAHTALAWRYPELLSRIELWLAGAAGAWNEGAIGLAWPLLWLGLIAGCAGQWMALGVSRRQALILAYALASLPLLSVHGALAGYADLWVAAALSFGVLAWLRWRNSRELGQLALALACLGLLPLFKFEGMVWALLVLGVGVLVEVPARRRWQVVALVGVAGLAGLLLAWLLHLPWVTLIRDVLSGATGSVNISRWSAALAFFNGLFGQNNWHLLWPLLLAGLFWQRDCLRRRPDTALLALLLAGGLCALFVLFVFTPAAKWAASATAANRLVLHWVPLAVSLLALLWREAAAGKAPPPVH